MCDAKLYSISILWVWVWGSIPCRSVKYNERTYTTFILITAINVLFQEYYFKRHMSNVISTTSLSYIQWVFSKKNKLYLDVVCMIWPLLWLAQPAVYHSSIEWMRLQGYVISFICVVTDLGCHVIKTTFHKPY